MKRRENSSRNAVVFYLNGERQSVASKEAGAMLADYLRYSRQLSGTKIVCAEGDCGACSVLRLFKGAGKDSTVYQPINSCITTVAQMDGSSLLTVEYLSKSNLDPVQKAMIACHGSQCGFCTPGFVVALKGLVEKRKGKGEESAISFKEAQNFLTGNLCRCTGYQQILEAASKTDIQASSKLCEAPWYETMNKDLRTVCKKGVFLETETFSFFAPTSLKEASLYLSKNPDCRILGAGTDLGVAVNKLKLSFQKTLSLHLIPELYQIKTSKKRIMVGARVTLEELREATKEAIPKFSSYLDIFASPQIKNVASLVGNLCNASPIGDTLPFLLAMNATLSVVRKGKTRKIQIEEFFLGYRKTALKKGELVSFIEFDIPSKEEGVYFFKTSQRKDLDISAVNGAIRLGSGTRVALGGVADVPIRLKSVERLLQDQPLTEELIQRSIEVLQKEIRPLSDVRGSSAFRRVLAQNFLRASLLEARGGDLASS